MLEVTLFSAKIHDNSGTLGPAPSSLPGTWNYEHTKIDRGGTRMKSKVLTIRFLCLLFILPLCILLSSCSSPEDKITRHQQKARQYIGKNKLHEAIIELRNVIQLDPNNDMAYHELGEIYVKLKDVENSFRQFHHAVVINPDNLKAHLRLGQIYIVAKKTKMAREAATLVLSRSPDDVEGLLLLSGVQIQERNLNSAMLTLEKAASIAPDNPKPHLFLAHLFYYKGNLERAERHYLKTISLDESVKNPYLELFQLYADKGDSKNAETILKRMVQSPGDKSITLTELAVYYENTGRFEKAEETYHEAIAASSAASSAADLLPLQKLAAFHERRDSYDKAIETMEKILLIDEDNLFTLTAVARIYLKNRALEQAEIIVDRILAKNSEDANANLFKAQLYLLKKDFPNAYRRLEITIRYAPDHAMAYYLRGMCLLQGKLGDLPGQSLFRAAEGFSDVESWNRKQAVDDLLKAVELNPKLINARYLLADHFIKDKKTTAAHEQISTALKTAPGNIRIMTLLASLNHAEGNLEDAVAICRNILAIDPDHTPSHLRLGLVYNALGQEEEALKAFEKALEISPMQTDALKYMVSIHMRAGRTDEAFRICESHKKSSTTSPVTTAFIEFLQGRIFLTRGDLAKAKLHLKLSIQKNPEATAPYEALVRIYEREKNIPAVIELNETILDRDPRNLKACMNLSRIFLDRDEKERAKQYLRKALEIKENFAPAANDLAYLMSVQKTDLTEATRLARIAKAGAPDNPDFLDTLGWLYYLQGSYTLAASELKRSLALNPANPLTNYHIGWTYYETDDFEKAREFMAKALKLDPDFPGADDARSILGR